jgi:hypothetical protein
MNIEQLYKKIFQEFDYFGEIEYSYFNIELILIPFPKFENSTKEELEAFLPSDYSLIVAKTLINKDCIIIYKKA